MNYCVYNGGERGRFSRAVRKIVPQLLRNHRFFKPNIMRCHINIYIYIYINIYINININIYIYIYIFFFMRTQESS
jgi:hypothetical protein